MSGADGQDRTPEAADLATRKLQLEVGKLQAEIPKLRREASWRATVVPMLLSMAAVSISGAQIVSTWNSNVAEGTRKGQAFQLDCLRAGSDMTKLLMDHWAEFDAATGPVQINYANTMLATLPPAVAERALLALAARVDPTDAATQNAFLTGILRARQLAADPAGHLGQETFPCPAVKDLAQVADRRPGHGVPVATAAEPAAAPPPRDDAAPPSAPPSALAKPRLLTFYHVTRRPDRATARLLAAAIEAAAARPEILVQFPPAGPAEWVRSADLAYTQIRYYRYDQAEAADILANLIAVAAKEAKVALTAKAVYIGGTFPNLPEGRIEVWFQPLSDALAGR